MAALDNSDHGIDFFAVIAILSFVVAVASATWATMPAHFRFQYGAGHLVEDYVDNAVPTDQTLRTLAVENDKRHVNKNLRIDAGFGKLSRKQPDGTPAVTLGPLFLLAALYDRVRCRGDRLRHPHREVNMSNDDAPPPPPSQPPPPPQQPAVPPGRDWIKRDRNG